MQIRRSWILYDSTYAGQLSPVSSHQKKECIGTCLRITKTHRSHFKNPIPYRCSVAQHKNSRRCFGCFLWHLFCILFTILKGVYVEHSMCSFIYSAWMLDSRTA